MSANHREMTPISAMPTKQYIKIGANILSKCIRRRKAQMKMMTVAIKKGKGTGI